MIRERHVILDQGIYLADEFMNSLVENAPGNWKRMTKKGKKDLTGCFHLLARDGKQIICFTEWRNEAEKKMTTLVITGIAHEYDCTAVGIFHEAWMVNGTLHRVAPWMQPSQHPHRQEALMLMMLTNAGSSNRTMHWPILREAGRARLGDVIEYAAESYGWDSHTFRDILPKRTILKN